MSDSHLTMTSDCLITSMPAAGFNTELIRDLTRFTGFITDGNSKLVGNARMRQVRIHKDSCRVAGVMHQSGRDCHAPYSWELEDMGSFGPGWSPAVKDNSSESLHSPWSYQSQGKLKAFPIWGSMVLYRGGGYAVDLGPDLQNSSR